MNTVKDILSYIDEIVLVRPEAICKTVTFPSEMRSICSALDSLISLYERGPESPRVGFTSLLSKVQRKTYLCWLWTLAALQSLKASILGRGVSLECICWKSLNPDQLRGFVPLLNSSVHNCLCYWQWSTREPLFHCWRFSLWTWIGSNWMTPWFELAEAKRAFPRST